ncbi:hypothetical protein THIAE_03185 [Thiomicrospira aerophila AL3]|uniref:Uncharacterized protein n=1 Tax=Thiomicrospira aerophila AL3 TaxID=717772 RepID=W0DUF3_9GAMM|nr:aminodeoxychorismate synthase component I [Thiomicrospira aerophila]AHF00913.1 hypothetical protein THIAE_03185 [Thiomicrospira aerophila AL3]
MIVQPLNSVGVTLVRQPWAAQDLLPLHRLAPQRYQQLLESVAKSDATLVDSAALGRFDILFAYCEAPLRLDVLEQATRFRHRFEQAWLSEQRQLSKVDRELLGDVPFWGGWFGYFAYEYAAVIEPSLNLTTSDLPLAWLAKAPAAIILDHAKHDVIFVAPTDQPAMLAQLQTDYAELSAQTQTPSPSTQLVAGAWQEDPPARYTDSVLKIRDYILAGDVFQVNISRLWQQARVDFTPAELYAQLRVHNPAPFACLVNLDQANGQAWSIISSSPERLVRVRDQWVDTRPIAGTRKRSDSLAADQALMAELIAHPKERAEHIMLIDLERNDLGRICQPGSVEVNELMVIESYQHVHHIVSNVRGKLQAQLTPLQVIEAMFPGGTITGCPKVRCMEIIAELEMSPREAYTGSVGYINYDGSMDFNILIRSFLQQGQALRFRAGAGIVIDSDPDAELAETRHKAKGLLKALSPHEC